MTVQDIPERRDKPNEATADRLARFEAVVEELVDGQADVARRMERLRTEGRTSTVEFRELLSRKLTHQYLLILMKKHGIEPKTREETLPR